METSRRQVIATATAAGLSVAWARRSNAQASQGDVFPPIPADQSAYVNQPDIATSNLVIEQLGTAHPTPHEIEMARKIMEGAPFGTRMPVDVARYFEGVGQGKENARFGEDVRSYVSGWPVRYNPVIINFFKATRTAPLALDGDATSWCAAFVNWCIARSLTTTGAISVDESGIMQPLPAAVLKGTDSASSGSFRCWSKDANASGGPKAGDVLVWAQNGTVNGCKPGPGHVGFYVGRAADGRYLTLGGNQRDPKLPRHAVVQKPIPTSFSNSEGVNTLNSIRTTAL